MRNRTCPTTTCTRRRERIDRMNACTLSGVVEPTQTRGRTKPAGAVRRRAGCVSQGLETASRGLREVTANRYANRPRAASRGSALHASGKPVRAGAARRRHPGRTRNRGTPRPVRRVDRKHASGRQGVFPDHCQRSRRHSPVGRRAHAGWLHGPACDGPERARRGRRDVSTRAGLRGSQRPTRTDSSAFPKP